MIHLLHPFFEFVEDGHAVLVHLVIEMGDFGEKEGNPFLLVPSLLLFIIQAFVDSGFLGFCIADITKDSVSYPPVKVFLELLHQKMAFEGDALLLAYLLGSFVRFRQMLQKVHVLT